MKPARIAAFALIVAAAFLAGFWLKSARITGSTPTSGEQKILRYLCPMHPQYTSDRPGDCPSCGMRLVPEYENSASGSARIKEAASKAVPGVVYLGPDKQQLIGVRIGTVEKTSGSRTIRVLGRVAVDETRIYRINAAITGWIREIYPNTVGSLVRKDQPLATFYAPEFIGPQQAYLYAMGAMDRYQSTGKETPDQIKLTNANIQQAADTLRNMGMHDIQVAEMKKTRELTQQIGIYSPTAGFVLARNISPGMRFESGTEFYRIADLSHVWILADMFENEAHSFRPGATARVTNAEQKLSIPARVSDVLPQFDAATRTMKVRLEAANPSFALRPDMFVDVEYPISMPATLTVPAEAVLDTGLRKTVFVDMGDGYFEPRRIATGWRMADRVEVVKGLMEGERIVVSGNFLIDSESRMREAAIGQREGSVEDPICGMQVDPVKAGDKRSTYKGEAYYFCSDQCKAKFDKDPEKYSPQWSVVSQKEMKSKSHAKSAKDLVCGMDVDISVPGVLRADYKGKTYYFCSEMCKKSFEENPEKYVQSNSKTMSQDDHMHGISE
jgi:membrane fusion protein, copper/silver efflux system